MRGLALHQLGALLRCELQLRSRRASTLVALLAVFALAWLSLSDPADGYALMVVGEQRLRYSSATLAFGSASLGALLFSLAGFYLVRGRTQEDLRSGMGGVLASSPLSSGLLLLARWLGAFSYLLLLALALMLSTWVLHGLRGEGPLQPLVYLQTYALMLLPALAATAAFALLADAWAPLSGRRGDVAYFFFWVMLLSLLPLHQEAGGGLTPLLLLDLSGMAATIQQLAALLGTTALSVGGSEFRAELGLREFPDGLWSAELSGLRLAVCLLALPPLALALRLFHRYAPEQVRAGARPRSRLAGWVRRLLLLQPIARGVAALLPLAARLPAPAATTAAELLLSLITQPLAVYALLVAWLAAAQAPVAELWAWQAGVALGWGLLAAELGARDAGASTAQLGASLPGGSTRRLRSRWGAALLLGLLAGLPLAWQRGAGSALAWTAGIALLAALSALAGRLTRGSRTFLALFLFWMLMAVQVRDIAWLDLLGFNGQAGRLLPLLMLALSALLLSLAAGRRS